MPGTAPQQPVLSRHNFVEQCRCRNEADAQQRQHLFDELPGNRGLQAAYCPYLAVCEECVDGTQCFWDRLSLYTWTSA